MNDAIALLAISQLVCIGGLGYLYLQLQALRQERQPRPRRSAPARVRPAAPGGDPFARPSIARAAQDAYAAAPGRPAPAGTVADRISELGIDIPALARRMRKSEDEVRLLLRRQGALR